MMKFFGAMVLFLLIASYHGHSKANNKAPINWEPLNSKNIHYYAIPAEKSYGLQYVVSYTLPNGVTCTNYADRESGAISDGRTLSCVYTGNTDHGK